MKKISIILAALLAAFSFASCSKEKVPSPSEPKGELMVNISVSNPGVDTKAVKTGWTAGDKLNIWYNDHTDYSTAGRPDLIMKFNGSSWVKDSEATLSGNAPSASGTLKVIYEATNDWYNNYCHDNKSYPYPVTSQTIGSYTAYKTPMTVFSSGVEYTVTNNVLSASISDWTYATSVQIVVTGIDSEDSDNYAMHGWDLYNTLGIGFNLSGNLFGNKGYYKRWQLAVPNPDGIAFNFCLDYDATEYDLTIYDLVNKVERNAFISNSGISLTDNKKQCVSIKIDISRFTQLNGFVLDGKTFSITNGEAALESSTYYDGTSKYSGDVVVPSSITYDGKTYPVTSIGSDAFLKCTELTSVTLPEGITYIGAGAFENATSLTKLVLPASLISIDGGNAVFNGSTNLEISVAPGSNFFFTENKILYRNRNANSAPYTVYFVPENMTGDIVLNANTQSITGNGTLYNTDADSIEFPEGFSDQTWGQFRGKIKDGLVLKFNYKTYDAFTAVFGTTMNKYCFGDSNCTKIVCSFPASMSDEDLAKLKTWFGANIKDVVRRS